MYLFSKKTCLTAALLLTLTACDSTVEDTDTITIAQIAEKNTGVFTRSIVEGLYYETATQSGFTNSLGEYYYMSEEMVTFMIGGILLGSTLAGQAVTPLSLVPEATDESNMRVINIVRLLMSLDSDGDPDNGITISPTVIDAAVNLAVDFGTGDLSTDEGVISLLAIFPSVTLVDSFIAINHFRHTLHILNNSTWGSLKWGGSHWRSAEEISVLAK